MRGLVWLYKGFRKVRPTHPREMLREDFLPGYKLTVSGFAKAIGVSRQTVNEVLRSPEMVLRLSRLFSISPEFWLNARERLICGKQQSKLRAESTANLR